LIKRKLAYPFADFFHSHQSYDQLYNSKPAIDGKSGERILEIFKELAA
jgi:hypothetical protein